MQSRASVGSSLFISSRCLGIAQEGARSKESRTFGRLVSLHVDSCFFVGALGKGRQSGSHGRSSIWSFGVHVNGNIMCISYLWLRRDHIALQTLEVYWCHQIPDPGWCKRKYTWRKYANLFVMVTLMKASLTDVVVICVFWFFRCDECNNLVSQQLPRAGVWSSR